MLFKNFIVAVFALSVPVKHSPQRLRDKNKLNTAIQIHSVLGINTFKYSVSLRLCVQSISITLTGKSYFSSFCRISTRRIFPLIVLGSSSTNSMTRGYL